MRRARRREFVMNDSEAEDLTEKARRACMSESQLIRLLIKGYQPPPAPSEQFYEDMNRLLETCDRLIEAAKYVHKSEGKITYSMKSTNLEKQGGSSLEDTLQERR